MTESGQPLTEDLDDSSPEGEDTEGARATAPVIARPTRRRQISAQASVFIEALVQTLSSTYESDPRRAKTAYAKICQYLFQIGLIDESWEMKELEGARVQFQHAVLKFFGEDLIRAPSLLLQGPYYTSQYRREFEECEKIGHGAYGRVFRVKYKLDGREYAVKKIPIHSSNIGSIKNCLDEVKTFASLNHPNIVQYRAAWFELGTPLDTTTTRWSQSEIPVPAQTQESHSSFQRETISTSISENSSSSGSSAKLDRREPLKLPSENEQHIGSLIETDGESSLEIVFSYNSRSSPTNRHSSSNRKSVRTGKALVPVQQNGVEKAKICWATLYIQMALCHGTLDQWLRQRNESLNSDMVVVPSGSETLRTKAIQQILVQILRGLEYIHSKRVVHHDIKPSNIFVLVEGGSLVVQLGDFGLACPLQDSRHDFARGTALYAAPEQLAGRCDPKSDMFSVGIVLFELLEDFNTHMERIKRITELRSRTDPPIPSDLSLVNLVPALVRRRPSERPDASTLLRALESDLPPDVETLLKRIEEQDKEIQRLIALLKAHGVQDS